LSAIKLPVSCWNLADLGLDWEALTQTPDRWGLLHRTIEVEVGRVWAAFFEWPFPEDSALPSYLK
jgi:hypothetical protein